MEKDEIIAGKPQDSGGEYAEQPTPENESSDTIYDISESTDTPQSSQPAEPYESSKVSDQSQIKEETEIKEEPEIQEDAELSQAEAELQKMLDDVGADTLLQIIKDNRNAAIRQIISEVEASRDRSIPSGTSTAPTCSSIFDLAALA